MQIFLISEKPIDTAMTLDSKRLNKQILECDWIIDGWKNNTKSTRHPVAKMYKDHLEWVELYKNCLKAWREGRHSEAQKYSDEALKLTPNFLCQAYFDNFKKRLYTKDSKFYKQFESYGATYENFYFIDNKWKIYVNGKCISEVDVL